MSVIKMAEMFEYFNENEHKKHEPLPKNITDLISCHTSILKHPSLSPDCEHLPNIFS